MNKDSQNTFHQLLSTEYQILFSGTNADNFQTIVNHASTELNASVVIADSLHYIIAMSDNIRSHCSNTISWLDLIENGFAPPLMEDTDNLIPLPPPSNFSEEKIGENLVIHDNLKTNSNMLCTMCDILDKGEIVLKLAISSNIPLTDDKRRLLLAFSLSVQFAYQRLHIDTATDTRGRYLLELLADGGISEKGFFTYNGFDRIGEFELLCFDTDDLGQHNLSFLPIASSISKMPHVLSVMNGSFCVLMVNKRYESASLYKQLSDFSSKYEFPILISSTFQELKDTPACYRIIEDAALLTRYFSGIKGLHYASEFSMFSLFEKTESYQLLHPDAKKLLAYDKEKQTQYALTVYCYLLHNCEAPRSAAALFIHRNTLDKRLRKIESLISGRWQDVSYQFLMLYSLYTLLKEEHLLPYFELF